MTYITLTPDNQLLVTKSSTIYRGDNMNTFMNNEPIMKSMSVARHEFIGNPMDLINSCMLLPFVIEEVPRDTYIKISVLSKQ